MTAFTPVVAQRLSKLIPRLASDHDGEVVATARAIDRTLRSSGCDWHDMVAAIEKPPETKVITIYREAPHAETAPETWANVAAWCRDHDRNRLTDKERRFVHDMAVRLVCGGAPSEKQGEWLRAIYAKLKAK